MDEILNNSLSKYLKRLSSIGRIDECTTEKMLVLDFINAYRSIVKETYEDDEILIGNVLLCIVGESCIFESNCNC